jgi:hypothetical protein
MSALGAAPFGCWASERPEAVDEPGLDPSAVTVYSVKPQEVAFDLTKYGVRDHSNHQ